MNRVIPHDAILIPNHAERAFKGVIFDVYQWSQDMFDGSTATFEMLKRPDTVICLAIKDDTIIFIREQQPGRPEHICLPGGRVDAGETWQAAMERECAEEIGLKFKNWRLIDVRQPVAKMEWFVALYLATDCIAERAVNHESGEKNHIYTYDIRRSEKVRHHCGQPVGRPPPRTIRKRPIACGVTVITGISRQGSGIA